MWSCGEILPHTLIDLIEATSSECEDTAEEGEEEEDVDLAELLYDDEDD